MMRGRQIYCLHFLLLGNSLSENSNLCYGSSSTLSNRGTHMAVSVVISFGGAKSRAFLDDRPRTRSADRPGHPRRHKPGHAGLTDAPPASLPAAQRKSRGGENFPLRKALKTHETRRVTTARSEPTGEPHMAGGVRERLACIAPRRAAEIEGGENLPLRKALKTHETRKSIESDDSAERAHGRPSGGRGRPRRSGLHRAEL
jgi:hypothetical protein